MRYELTPSIITAVKSGAAISAGIDHPACAIEGAAVPELVRASLANDLKEVAVN